MSIYIFLLLVLLILYIILKYYKKESFTQNIVKIKRPSGHFCDTNLDSISDRDYRKNIGDFCKKYPNKNEFNKITTNIIIDKTKINRKKLKILKTKNLKINKIFTNQYIKTKEWKGTVLRKQNLSENEALEMCTDDYLCDGITINDKIPETIFWKSGNIPIKNALIKKYNYEYTITFWIKIDNLNTNWRNIFHHGNTNKHRFPGIWIKPNSTDIYFAITTTKSNVDSWGESLSVSNIPLRKWTQISFIVKNNKVISFVNGSLVEN